MKKPGTEHQYFTLPLLNKPLRVANGLPTSVFLGGILLAVMATLATGSFYVGGGIVGVLCAINGFLRKQHTKNKIPDYLRGIILKAKSPNYVYDDGKSYKRLIHGRNQDTV